MFPRDEGKFRTKGLVYHGALEFWEATVPGGVEAVLQALADAQQGAAVTLLREKIVPGAWYPVMPILPSAVAAARLRKVPVANHVRENAVWVARRDLHGVYKVLLGLASVEAVAMRLGGLSMRYFDFGGAETRKVGPGAIESERVGIPAALAAWFTWAAEGFIPVALQLAGARTVAVRSTQPRAEGERYGVATVRLTFAITWT